MVDSDPDPNTQTDDHPSREEILQAHEPIHTYPRPKGREPTGAWGSVVRGCTFVAGFLFGVVLLPLWMGTVGGFFFWLVDHLPPLDDDLLAFCVIALIPPGIGIGWAMLREPEREVPPMTKRFLVGMLCGYVLCGYLVVSLLAT